MSEVAVRNPDGNLMEESGVPTCAAGDDAAVAEDIKTEGELGVTVKPERHECCVCLCTGAHCCDMYERRSVASGTPLHSLLVRFSSVDPASRRGATPHLCSPCADLLDLLERAEIEFTRLKRDFEQVISKNPLFAASTPTIEIEVKNESFEEMYPEPSTTPPILDDDSENEPLAVTRKKRHKPFRKKKSNITSNKNGTKRKKHRWECTQCGVSGWGDADVLVAHIAQVHCGPLKDEEETILPDTNYRNGFTLDSGKTIKVEVEGLEQSESILSQLLSEKRRGRPRKRQGGALLAGEAKNKTLLPCDQCDSKFSSIGRLEHHKLKHSGSKPPYICEVCGAHYKHRRACDIHIAMHKGISDWKCEQCNKLFPSKGALHRHNNIHTGKTNYQCDQCGKSFIHTSSFKMHKLAHSGVKPHKCGVCGLALMTSSHLKRHLRIHSGEKRYECGVCGKRFSERYNLAAHEKSHSAVPDSSADRPPLVRRAVFRCHFCAERFERRYMLERHSAQAHGRTLERPPARPRNTMSKLLKAQAQAKQAATPPTPAAEANEVQLKQSESRPESRAASSAAGTPAVLVLKDSPPATAWSTFPADYARLADYPH